VFIATFIAKGTPCHLPEMTFISIHWASQLHLSSTATLRTVKEN
jgi:hypothetical protein